MKHDIDEQLRARARLSLDASTELNVGIALELLSEAKDFAATANVRMRIAELQVLLRISDTLTRIAEALED